MGVIKNDVGRPSNKTIMIRRIFKLLLGIILVIGCYFIGYKLGSTVSNKEENKKEEIKNEENVKKEEINNEENVKKELDNKTADKILQEYFGVNNEWANYLWLTYKLDLSDENDKAYLAITSTDYSKEKFDLNKDFNAKYSEKENNYVFENNDFVGSYTNKFYKYNDVNKVYKKLFGNKINLKKEDVSKLANVFVYSKKVDAFAEVLLIWGDGGYDIIGGITNAYELNNKVFITVVYGEVTFGLENEYVLTLKDDTIVNLTETEAEDKNLYKKYADKLEMKEYTFFKEDGIYKLESVKEN